MKKPAKRLKRPWFSTLQLWAFRTVYRRPLETMLMATALTVSITCVGTLLLFPRAVNDTVDKRLEAAPDIILRQVDATGWKPLPIQRAMQAAKTVVGVVSVRPRVWGLVLGPEGPLTIFGVQQGVLPEAYRHHLTLSPDRGQAIVGPGVVSPQLTENLQLEGVHRGGFQVIARLPDETSMFTHDLVLLNILDARRLLGLADGYASDLAIDVFHEAEQQAILSDLSAAFPWPVRCTTKRQSAGVYAGGLNRIGTLGAITIIPAVLAVCLLVAVSIRKSMGRQSDLGIMKAMGWSTGDIVRMRLYGALIVCLPSAAFGMSLSFLLVYWPGVNWMGRLFFGWQALPPILYLNPEGAVTVLLEVAGLILAPVIASALIPAVKAATVDTYELIEGAGGS